jgi:hypothetical protein
MSPIPYISDMNISEPGNVIYIVHVQAGSHILMVVSEFTVLLGSGLISGRPWL